MIKMNQTDAFSAREAAETLRLLDRRQWVTCDAFFTQRLISRIEQMPPDRGWSGWRPNLRRVFWPALVLLTLLINLTSAVWFFDGRSFAAEDRHQSLTAFAEEYAINQTTDVIERLSQ
jgi:hypothetical protein